MMDIKIKSLKIKMDFLLVIAIGSIPVQFKAQHKKMLQEKDYVKWHTLSLGPVSPDGLWSAFSTVYPNGKDTLYLSDGNKQYRFPDGHNITISHSGKYFALQLGDTLKLVEPRRDHIENIVPVEGFILSGNLLVCKAKGFNGRKVMVRDLESGRQAEYNNVDEFSINPHLPIIALVTSDQKENSVQLIDIRMGFRSREISYSSDYNFRGLQWNANGIGLAFFGFIPKEVDNHCLYYYNCSGSIEKLIKMPNDGLSNTKQLSNSKLYLSNDASQVFFDVVASTNGENQEQQVGVSVFRSTDLLLPHQPVYSKKRWHMWRPASGEIMQVESDSFPDAVLTGDQKYALLFDDKRYLPLPDFMGTYRDIYLKDLETGQSKLIISKVLHEVMQLIVSNSGKYIAYFKERKWWLYDIYGDRHLELKGDNDSVFLDTDNDHPYELPFGIGGWTENDRGVLLYDRYDVWLFDCATGKGKRLSDGRERDVAYRVYDPESKVLIRDSYATITANTYNSKELVFQSKNPRTLGYELFRYYTENKGLVKLAGNDADLKIVSKARDKECYYFIEESYELPPQLVKIDNKRKKTVIFKTNSQQQDYFWGQSALIRYDANGKAGINGALFYPADYDAGKSYPMVVYIYEVLSQHLHRYAPPTLELYDGFNVTNYTANGYFVLMPDISYTLNEPGRSALECVLAASRKALETASIDEGRIALMGHSFGGFETSYIISQTDFFRAAIAGAAVTDLLSSYLTIDPFNLSNMERYDNGQFRNRLPFYSEGFAKESPLQNVQSIHTPLLLWAGTEDRLVDTSHSIKLYSALWKMKKESALLLYKDEHHVIENPKRQLDLYRKIMEWLDHYLKDGPKPIW